MGVLKGRNSAGAWVDASVVYGWNSSGVKTYAKAMFMRKADNTWERAWTDCRQHDAAGGRDWASSSSSVTVTCADCSGCGTSTKVVTTVTYTKTGCTTYTRTSETACTACGTWTPYFDFVTIQLNSGEYVTGTIWGWLYSDAAGNANVSCAGGSGLVGPENVDICSVGGYRKTGTDQCVIISI